MYVCMYVCMYVGMYVCMYTCMYVYMYAFWGLRLRRRTRAHGDGSYIKQYLKFPGVGYYVEGTSVDSSRKLR